MTLKSGYSNNRGQQLVRGKGAEFTTGEWITYVDSPLRLRTRLEHIDIAKGIGIVLVVFGHLSGIESIPHWLTLSRSFIYQFHIPLFFFISGMFYKGDDAWGAFLIKKTKRLYVPFVVANGLFLIIDVCLRCLSHEPVVLVDNLKHFVKVLLLLSVTPLGGATWFLKALFVIAILYKFLWQLSESRLFVLIICLLLGFSGTYIQPDYSASAIMVGLLFYCLGNNVKLVNYQNVSYQKSTILALVFLSVLVLMCAVNNVDIAMGIYQNRLLVFPGAVIGIIMILLISSMLSNVRIISKMLSYLGQHTMSILIGHFLAFKIVIVVQMLLCDLPVSVIMSHPCYDVSRGWWIAYFVLGLLLPVVPAYLKEKRIIVCK